jgi:hypothetical protein
MRPNWLALAAALGVGLAAGLYYAWVVSPVKYVDTAPASLRRDFQDEYLALIASAYTGTGDLERARLRLGLIPEVNPAARLASLAQQRLAVGLPEREARALADLAAALGERPLAAATTPGPGASASAPPTRTRTATPTLPPLPTRTASPTPGAPFQLVDRDRVCDPDLAIPLIMVEVVDSAGQPVPFVEVLVIWDTGQDRFFTGFKPELGTGYGDFAMSEGLVYSVRLAAAPQTVTGLSVPECQASDEVAFPGSWLLTFAQPAATAEP